MSWWKKIATERQLLCKFLLDFSFVSRWACAHAKDTKLNKHMKMKNILIYKTDWKSPFVCNLIITFDRSILFGFYHIFFLGMKINTNEIWWARPFMKNRAGLWMWQFIVVWIVITWASGDLWPQICILCMRIFLINGASSYFIN
jgi:hypothetical protein